MLAKTHIHAPPHEGKKKEKKYKERKQDRKENGTEVDHSMVKGKEEKLSKFRLLARSKGDKNKSRNPSLPPTTDPDGTRRLRRQADEQRKIKRKLT